MSLDQYLSHPAEWVIGADEVGNGAICGPALVAAVLVRKTWAFEGLRDSKKYFDRLLGEHARALRALPEVHVELGWIPSEGLEYHHRALELAHQQTISACLAKHPEALVIIDGTGWVLGPFKYMELPKADQKIPAVMAASVIAKYELDSYMRGLHQDYPVYGLDTNVGYGTPAHLAALDEHGPCPEHRPRIHVRAALGQKFATKTPSELPEFRQPGLKKRLRVP